MKKDELKKIISEEVKSVLEEQVTSEIAQKVYNQLSNAIFMCLKDKTLKKEFYKKLTSLQKEIETFVFKNEQEK